MKKNNISKNKSVTIIGAGIGGLYSAWELIKSGYDVTVIEKQNSVGGLSSSISEMGYKIDIGPHYLTLPKSSEITNTIFEIMGENIFEVPQIENWYKSYFHGKFINGFPTLYDAIYSDNVKSIFQSIFSLISAKIFLSSHKSDNVEKYLISIYGNFLYKTWCKPYLLQTIGHLDIPLEYAKKKFKPITFSKIIKKFFSFNKKNNIMIQNNKISNYGEYYFKDGIGHLANILEKKILDSGGKIILNANIETITHEKVIKNICYSYNENMLQHETDIIIYATPINITKKWFNINEEISNNNLHSIMVILFVDSPKIFDGWVLGVFDNKSPFFRIAQQTYLSKHVAPPGKSLLSIEIRSYDDDPLWKKDNKKISKQIEQSLRNIGLLKNEKIEGSKVIKLRNIYSNIFQNSNLSKSENIDFLKSIKNEYLLGSKEVDSGRLVSNDDQSNENISFGGIFTAIQESNYLVKKIISKN